LFIAGLRLCDPGVLIEIHNHRSGSLAEQAGGLSQRALTRWPVRLARARLLRGERVQHGPFEQPSMLG
jgi:hypothetical protein